MHTVFVLTFPRHWLCLCVCVTVKCVVFLCVLNCIGMLIRWNRISINGQGSSCKEQGGNPVISPLVHHTYIVSQGIMVGSCPISCQRANSMPRFWSPSKKMCFSWCCLLFSRNLLTCCLYVCRRRLFCWIWLELRIQHFTTCLRAPQTSMGDLLE